MWVIAIAKAISSQTEKNHRMTAGLTLPLFVRWKLKSRTYAGQGTRLWPWRLDLFPSKGQNPLWIFPAKQNSHSPTRAWCRRGGRHWRPRLHSVKGNRPDKLKNMETTNTIFLWEIVNDLEPEDRDESPFLERTSPEKLVRKNQALLNIGRVEDIIGWGQRSTHAGVVAGPYLVDGGTTELDKESWGRSILPPHQPLVTVKIFHPPRIRSVFSGKRLHQDCLGSSSSRQAVFEKSEDFKMAPIFVTLGLKVSNSLECWLSPELINNWVSPISNSERFYKIKLILFSWEEQSVHAMNWSRKLLQGVLTLGLNLNQSYLNSA